MISILTLESFPVRRGASRLLWCAAALAIGLAGCGREDSRGGAAAGPTAVEAGTAERDRSELREGEAEGEAAVVETGSQAALREAVAEPEAEPGAIVIDVFTDSGRPAAGLIWSIQGPDDVVISGPLVFDRDGRLEVPGVWLENPVNSGGREVAGVELTLRTAVLGAPTPEFTLPETLPERPLEVRVPDFGSVVVQLVDPPGEPISIKQSITASVQDYRRIAGGVRLGRGALSQTTGSDAASLVHFSAVAMGRRLWINSDATIGISGSLDVAGPVTDGERVDLKLEGRGALPELLMRLVDDTGAALAKVRVHTLGRASYGGSALTLTLGGDSPITDEPGTLRFMHDRTLRGLELNWLELREQRGERRAAAVRLPESIEGFGTARARDRGLAGAGTDRARSAPERIWGALF